MGDRRPPSPLGSIQPEVWPAEYNSELLDLINVPGLLVELEPVRADLLDKVCAGPLINAAGLAAAGVLDASSVPAQPAHPAESGQAQLF